MNLDPKKTIFLIDGSSFLYRAYYSMRPLHAKTGQAVQAVYGFCRMIKKLIEKFHPEQMIVVWDSKGKTFRHEMYESYKENRTAPPRDIFDQKELINEFADIIQLTHIAQSGLEADDIMYSIAQEQKKEGKTVVFVTSDKDMGQAIDEQVLMYDADKEVLFDQEKFEEKMGIPISKMPFYFSLLGDASDNIPGVRGVGKKGAQELVTQFESLEDMYGKLYQVKKPRTSGALAEHKKEAFLSRDLFLLKYTPTNLSIDDYGFDARKWTKAEHFFRKLGFKSLLTQMGVAAELTMEQKMAYLQEKYRFKCVTTQQGLQELCDALKASNGFALDTETCGIRPLQDIAVGISFCVQEDTAYYVPFGHTVDLFTQQLSQDQVVTALKPILEDAAYDKYLHNVKFDQLVLHALGIELQGKIFDTMIAAHLLSQGVGRVGLKFLSETLLNEEMLTFKELVKENKLPHFAHVPLDIATVYSGHDSLQTFKLYELYTQQFNGQKELQRVFDEIEMPLVRVLYEMEAIGIYCDRSVLQALDSGVSKKIDGFATAILELAGVQHADINLNSPRQISQLLFEELQLPPQKKSGKGDRYSTDQEVLVELAKLHPIPGLLIKYRELVKLKSTYIDALPQYINPKTGNIHTTFNQVLVATGRLSSSDPNLQNIPADGSEYGSQIRDAFKAPDGHVFVSADYSQIELRILAHLSGDKALTDAFLSGQDIHAQTAAKLFDVAFDAVTHEQRQIGKRINFSILYGLTPYGLSKDLGISYGDAQRYIDTYFEQYPEVSSWMESVVDFAKEHGYVQTVWGRRRAVPGICEANKGLFQEARRIAINTVAQGTAADLVKCGMIAVREQLRQRGLDAQMILQIHDELLLSVPVEEKEAVELVVQEVLESVVDWKIPLQVSIRSGATWKQAGK